MKRKVEKYLYGKNIDAVRRLKDNDDRYLIGDDIDGCLRATRHSAPTSSSSSNTKVVAKWGPSAASAAAVLGKTTVSSSSEIAMKYGKDLNVASLPKKLGSGTFVDDRSSVVPKEATHIKTFEDRFEELKAYKAKHGKMNVTLEMKEENAVLYNFCQRMRRARAEPEKGKFNLTTERIALIDSIGFSWVRERSGKKCAKVGCNAKICGEISACQIPPYP